MFSLRDVFSFYGIVRIVYALDGGKVTQTME